MDSNQQSIGDPCPPVEVNNRGSSALPRGADHTYHVTTPPHRAQTRCLDSEQLGFCMWSHGTWWAGCDRTAL